MRELQVFRMRFSLGSEDDQQRAIISWARVTTDEYERACDRGVCTSCHIAAAPAPQQSTLPEPWAKAPRSGPLPATGLWPEHP